MHSMGLDPGLCKKGLARLRDFLFLKNGQKVGMKLSRKGFDRVVHTENTPPVTDHPDMGAKNKKTSFFWPSLSSS